MTSDDCYGKTRLSKLQDGADDEYDGIPYDEKKKIGCICPKCGRQHVMAFHWIGRGVPRKYCPSCKGGHRE